MFNLCLVENRMSIFQFLHGGRASVWCIYYIFSTSVCKYAMMVLYRAWFVHWHSFSFL